MSNRLFLKPFPAIAAGTSASSSRISLISNINQISYMSYSVTFTGSPVGTLQVEVCNDAQFDPNGAYVAGTGSWVPIYFNVNGTNANSIAISGAGNTFIDIDGIAAAFMRLHYTATSGSGTISATLAGKVS
jgi:hypothetical protein